MDRNPNLRLIENGINVVNINVILRVILQRSIPFLKPFILINLCGCNTLQWRRVYTVSTQEYSQFGTSNQYSRPLHEAINGQTEYQHNMEPGFPELTVLGFGSKIRLISFLAPAENQVGQVNSAR